MTPTPWPLLLGVLGVSLAACAPREGGKPAEDALTEDTAHAVDTAPVTTEPCAPDEVHAERALSSRGLIEGACEGFGNSSFSVPVLGGVRVATGAKACPDGPIDGGAVFLYEVPDTGAPSLVLEVIGDVLDANLSARMALTSGDSVRGEPLFAASWTDGRSGLTIGGTYVWEGANPDPVATIYTPDFYIGQGLAYGSDLFVAAAPVVDDRAGRLYVYDAAEVGPLGPEDAIAVHQGAYPDAELGYNLHAVGDVDGDGRRDFVVDDGGRALLLVAADAEVDQGVDYGLSLGVWLPLGDSATDVGDWDGDGLADVAVGDQTATRESGGHVGVFSWTQADPLLYFYPGFQDLTEIGQHLAGRSEPAGLYVSGLASVPEGASFWLVEPPACGTTTLADVGSRLVTPQEAPTYLGGFSAVEDLLVLGLIEPDLALEFATVPQGAAR